ncbi:MAG: hypothetical protein ACWA5W_01675, partial [Phycisphaerales bacterium]
PPTKPSRLMNINQTITISKYEFDNSRRGAECVFVTHVRHTTRKSHTLHRMVWGLKVYPKASQALKALRAQQRYWEKDLAPEVGELVRVKVRGSKTMLYGYFTEQIEGKTAEEYMPSPCPIQDELPLGFHLARRELKHLGYTDLDDHLENIMLCQRRMRWIAVDFGAYSSWKQTQ